MFQLSLADAGRVVRVFAHVETVDIRRGGRCWLDEPAAAGRNRVSTDGRPHPAGETRPETHPVERFSTAWYYGKCERRVAWTSLGKPLPDYYRQFSTPYSQAGQPD